MTPEEYLDFLEQLFDLFDPPIELSLPDFDAKGPHVHGTVEMFGAAQRGGKPFAFYGPPETLERAERLDDYQISRCPSCGATDHGQWEI